MQAKDLNLFSAYRKSPQGKGNGGASLLVVAIVLLAVMGSLYAAMLFFNKNLEAQITSLNSQINDPQIVALQTEVASLTKEREMLNQYIQAAKKAGSNFAASRFITAEVLNEIFNALPTGTAITSYNINTVALSLTCKADQFNKSVLYATNLEQSSLFANVSYNSVVYDESQGGYMFIITLGFEPLSPTATAQP